MRQVTVFIVALALLGSACSDSGSGDTVTVYSGRSEELIAPLIERFEEQTGIDVAVRYAGSTELAATILEEGAGGPADVFFAQDPASLGTVALAGRFSELPEEIHRGRSGPIHRCCRTLGRRFRPRPRRRL